MQACGKGLTFGGGDCRTLARSAAHVTRTCDSDRGDCQLFQGRALE
jgi:hypothetical protein